MDYVNGADLSVETNEEKSPACVELSDLELAMTGGGCGETVFH